MRPYRRETAESNEPILIGYYPFRAKAQLPRLLCEYLHVKYVDVFLSPDEWSRFKDNEAKGWIIKDMPFCIDGNFAVTGPTAVTHYVIQKAGRPELLGRNLPDKIKIDTLKNKHDLKTAILALICTCKPSYMPEENKDMMEIWKSKVEPILLQYESECPEAGWYYGYVTIMDFVVYELLNLISMMFPQELIKFKRLLALGVRFSNVPEIRNYENSSRAVREYSPVVYFSKFKEEKMKNRNSNCSKESSTEMELE